jgi:hypothetical protein
VPWTIPTDSFAAKSMTQPVESAVQVAKSERRSSRSVTSRRYRSDFRDPPRKTKLRAGARYQSIASASIPESAEWIKSVSQAGGNIETAQIARTLTIKQSASSVTEAFALVAWRP